MKILRGPIEQNVWVGKKVECSNKPGCGAVFELDEYDKKEKVLRCHFCKAIIILSFVWVNLRDIRSH